MAHIVHCRVCKQKIDIDSSHNWIMPSTNWYYHSKCYEDWIMSKRERAVIYFYEVQHGNAELAKGGIGIVGSIYYESAQYWANLETKRKGVLDDIVRQMEARRQRPVINVADVARRNGPRIKFSLDDIGEDEDD